MGILDFVPRRFWSKDKLDDLVNFMNKYFERFRDRKFVILEWSKRVGVEVTGELIDRIRDGKG